MIKLLPLGHQKGTFNIFLSIYLISLTELNQLVKFPSLIKHFIEHKEKDGNLSFLGFLDMHYAHGDVMDADYAEDMKLPFKSHDGCVNSFAMAFIPNEVFNPSTKPVFTENKNYSIYQESFLTSAYLSFIWQPPKSC